MRKVDCSNCDSKDIPLDESIKIDGKVYCKNCLESQFPDPKMLENKTVVKEFDPTICSSCNKDFGDTVLNKISNYPICTDCETTIKNKTFPVWVKGFFIGILVIVVGSFIWNWKYYSAYKNIKESNAFFRKGDYTNATLLMKSASDKVPEVGELEALSEYFHGIELLTKDKNAEALEEFKKCLNTLPPDYDIQELIIEARIGATFDNKDYKGFLGASKELLASDSSTATAFASVASAYACLYADKGNEEDKKSCFDYLQKAKLIDSTSEDMKSYYNMIEYRIDSRKIIKREEFVKQFPNGWTK